MYVFSMFFVLGRWTHFDRQIVGEGQRLFSLEQNKNKKRNTKKENTAQVHTTAIRLLYFLQNDLTEYYGCGML